MISEKLTSSRSLNIIIEEYFTNRSNCPLVNCSSSDKLPLAANSSDFCLAALYTSSYVLISPSGMADRGQHFYVFFQLIRYLTVQRIHFIQCVLEHHLRTREIRHGRRNLQPKLVSGTENHNDSCAKILGILYKESSLL